MKILTRLFAKNTPESFNPAQKQVIMDRRYMIRLSETAVNFRNEFRMAAWDENLPESFMARRSYSSNSA